MPSRPAHLHRPGPATVRGSDDIDANRLRVASDFSQDLVSTALDWPALTATVTQGVADGVGDAAALFLRSDDERWLDLVATHHRRPEGAELIRTMFSVVPHSAFDGLLGPVVASAQPLFLAEVDQRELSTLYAHPLHHEYFERFGVSSLIVAPLAAHGHLLGVLVLARDTDSARYNDLDLDLAVDLASRAALALHNGQLLARSRAAAEELEGSRALLSAILTSAIDAVIVIDASGAIESINPAAEKLLGYAAAEVVGTSVNVLIPPSQADVHDEHLRRHLAGETSSVVGDCREVSLRHRDGSEVAVEIALSEVSVGSRHLFVGIARDVGRRKRAEQVLRRRATTDPLTGLVNRASLHRVLVRSMERVDAGRHLALLFLDLDGFKDVNDSFGHAVGDQVLRQGARRLTSAVRDHDMVVRYGGDEFVIVIESDEDIEADSRLVAKRVRAAFAAPFTVGDQQQVIDVSIGVAVHPDDGLTISQLIEHSDAAMYADKRAKSRPARSGA